MVKFGGTTYTFHAFWLYKNTVLHGEENKCNYDHARK